MPKSRQYVASLLIAGQLPNAVIFVTWRVLKIKHKTSPFSSGPTLGVLPKSSETRSSIYNKSGRTIMSVKPIPEGYHSITRTSASKSGRSHRFYKKAFGAIEVMRPSMPDGGIGHAELRIGDCPIMLGTPCDQGPLSNPDQSPSVGLHLYDRCGQVL
jgi:hypothetical protein